MDSHSAATGEQLRTAIWAALRDVDLWPEWETYEAGTGRVVGWGEIQIGEVRAAVGAGLWERTLRASTPLVSDVDVVRMLGIGRLISEYILAPIDVSGDNRTRLAQLGALANLIVAMYDHLLDARPDPRQPLTRKALAADDGRPGFMLAWQRSLGTRDQRFIARLVQHYYQALGRLARESRTAPDLIAFIHRTIRRMYDAEQLTRAPAGRCRTALRRKAALPFVVMGLPGWLLASSSQASFSWHLRWSYRVGLFFGAIDDAVDVDNDRAASRPNRFAAQLSDESSPEQALQGLGQAIARRSAALAVAWRTRVQEADRSDPVLSKAINIATCSWFGGTGWRSAHTKGERYGV